MKSISASLLASACLVLGACSSTPITTGDNASGASSLKSGASTTGAQGNAAGATARPQSQVATVALPGSGAGATPSSERSVYFDYDDFSIHSPGMRLVERHGSYLAARPGTAIKIEGNADERGSREYNLALGQKRAESVGRALALLGAEPQQVEAVSFGEERPAVQGSDEAAWAKNRRAEIKDR